MEVRAEGGMRRAGSGWVRVVVVVVAEREVYTPGPTSASAKYKDGTRSPGHSGARSGTSLDSAARTRGSKVAELWPLA